MIFNCLGFSQPDGFSATLSVTITQDGNTAFTATWRTTEGKNRQWTVNLDREQSRRLGQLLIKPSNEPVHYLYLNFGDEHADPCSE